MAKDCGIIFYPGLVILICLLAGCRAGRQLSIIKKPSVVEASVGHVPFPSDVKVRRIVCLLERDEAISNEKGWEYETTLTASQLHEFYTSQAELEGWRELSSIYTASGDLMLVYQRPRRVLVVDARRVGSHLRVRCFSAVTPLK